MRADADELLTLEASYSEPIQKLQELQVNPTIEPLVPVKPAKVSISKLPGTLIPLDLYAPQIPDELVDAAARMMSTNQLSERQVRDAVAQYMIISDMQWGIVMSDPRMMHARGQARRMKIEDARDALAQTVIDQVKGLNSLADLTDNEEVELKARAELLKYGVQVSLAAEATHSPTNIQVNVNNAPTEPTWQQRIRDNSVKNFDGGSTVIAVRTE
tara:strand:- start:1316 stop:1960 length:645 start_codon:yes stop_codon:yes gene_type:complete